MMGSPIFFPATAVMTRDNRSGTLIFVVPLDDERTWFVEHRAWPSEGQGGATNIAPFHDVPGKDENGLFLIATANGQDHMAVVTQGATVDRRKEHLGTTDAGLIMYRQLLLNQARLVADGAEPINIRHYGPSKKQIDPPKVPIGRATVSA